MHRDGHPNKSCVKIRDPKAPTNLHVWQNSACVKRGPLPFLVQPGGRAWWLPWPYSWTLAYAPRAADQDNLASDCTLEDKGKSVSSM